jgi:ribonuclease P protein component
MRGGRRPTRTCRSIARSTHSLTVSKDANETHLPTEQQAAEADARVPVANGHTRRARRAEASARQRPQAVDRVDPGQAATLTAAPSDRAERFPPRLRLRKRAEFLALQREGQRAAAPHFVVITRPSDGPSRLGITTSRKVANAPGRNRIRRLVREFFRHNRLRLASPRDVLVIARPGAAQVTFSDVHDELSRALGLDRDR